jgi:hypothetical protein
MQPTKKRIPFHLGRLIQPGTQEGVQKRIKKNTYQPRERFGGVRFGLEMGTIPLTAVKQRPMVLCVTPIVLPTNVCVNFRVPMWSCEAAAMAPFPPSN